MTQLAALSDIHGNAIALRAVLEELDAEGIESGVCLGDVCQGGPEPEACVDLFGERGWPTVLGNADAFVLDPSSAQSGTETVSERQLEVRQWTYDRLGSARRDAVASYAPTVSVDLGDGRTLLGCHAIPADYDSVVLPDAAEDEFRAAFGGTGADGGAVFGAGAGFGPGSACAGVWSAGAWSTTWTSDASAVISRK